MQNVVKDAQVIEYSLVIFFQPRHVLYKTALKILVGLSLGGTILKMKKEGKILSLEKLFKSWINSKECV